MGVAVLNPQDCIRSSHYSRKPLISPPPKMKLPNPNPKQHRATRAPSNRQKRAPNQTRPAPDANPQVNKLVLGQVKILKRGEQLTKTAPDPDPKTEATAAAQPCRPIEPEPLTERVGGGNLYAGYSISVASPPPSSVPLPAFVTKKILAVSDATNDLRKILRLELS